MLAVARPSTDITAWCNTTSTSRSSDIVAEAYKNAVKFFENELSYDPKQRAWISKQNSLKDVLQVVSDAQTLYETKSDKKAKKWVNALAGSITQYGGVFDVLAQADPLHAGLAWGAIKFVFSGVLNHAQMVAELSKALTKINEAMPRVQIELAIYQSPWMQDAVSRLYAHVLLFLQKAVQWYNRGSLRRAIGSIFKPYPLAFQDTVLEITRCTKAVDAIANTSSHAEIRCLTNAMKAQDQKLHDVQTKMMEAQAQICQVLQLATNHFALSNTIKEDTSDMRPRIQQIHIKDVLDVLRSSQLPEEWLEACESYTKRRLSWRQPGRDTVLASQRLKEWLQLTGSSMFVVRAAPRAEARTKDMAVEMTRLLTESGLPVFWYFSSPASIQTIPSLDSVLKSLIFQALRHDPSIVSQDTRLGNIQAFQAHHTITEWTKLAILTLSKIKECFIVVDTEDLFRSAGHNSAEAQQTIDTFNKIFEEITKVGNTTKLLLVGYGIRASLHAQAAQVCPIVVSLNPPLPVVRRARQPLVPQFRLGSGRLQLQPRLKAH